MPRHAAAAVACLLAVLRAAHVVAAEPAVDGLSLGQLQLVMPAGEPRGLVFLFSDQTGPTPELDRRRSRSPGWA